jgi:NADPH:quinone reductase-like Zn-dependent oxidoreductase
MTAATPSAWALEIARDELSRTRLLDLPAPEPADGEAVLRTDRVGMTANNVTYAVIGEAFHYWDFFPASEAGWGRVPLWGFAEVVASRAAGVDVGSRVYGFLPTASHLVVRPDRVDAGGFRDAAEHRAPLPSPYNAYALTTGDPSYEADREDLQVLFRPLFLTSFLLADQLQDSPGTVVLSSASSKTAYGAAFLLREAGREVVGLTSPGNVAFTESLGCYDRVVPYDDVTSLARQTTSYVDLAGSSAVRQALHEHLDSDLALDLVVGVTHQDSGSAGRLPGPRPTVFFAPDRLRQRSEEWGRAGLDERFARAWGSFVPVVEGWVDVTRSSGPQALQATFLEVLGGRSDPRTGHVLQL